MKAHPKHLGRLAALALLLATAAAHGAPPAGRLLASQCAQCHGTNGQAVAGMEKLAGYSDAQIRLIARYFATGGRTTATTSTTSTTSATSTRRKSHDD